MARPVHDQMQSQRGFTLLEVMAGVAVIGILATVAVAGFVRTSRKASGRSEVAAMFAEIGAREDAYKSANGSYLAAPACPATTSPSGASASTCLGSGSPWSNLAIQPTSANLKCSYQISVGTATTTPTVPAGFTFVAPPASWYTILATCDEDGSPTVNATYFTSSADTSVQAQNEGK